MPVGTPRGLYVHVPFCAKRCDYCDFTTFAGRDDQMADYVDALCTELRRIGQVWEGHTLHTLFIGGGTPTLLEPTHLAEMLDTISTAFQWAPDAEWTIEANPETVTAITANCLADHGINRVSMGAQSFDPMVLDLLGRWHRPGQVAQAVTHVRDANIAQVSLDLIFGTPGETVESWAGSLQTALDLGPDHLSAYALTVEPATPYGRRAKINPQLIPDEDLQGERLAVTAELLSDWDHYEVSNWARTPYNRCRHNLAYWHGDDWLAAGVGATGALGNRRWWNTRSIDRYLKAIAQHQSPEGGSEQLDADALRLEALMMGLRTVEGVAKTRVEPLDAAQLQALYTSGLLIDQGEMIHVPPTHFNQVDGIVRALI
ncbi:radical SAM family heme chaperone HemW [Stomatohabitans albus]|uniref:radical SAM family heme chaperone HemW n=1 Tax=Stomatohabitans albus TaxID=3110766 RepID=UPI00300C12C6